MGSSHLLPSISSADESIMTLQQDIIAAKQKHSAFIGKMDAIDQVVDKKKSEQLESEAQNLIQELTKSGYSHTQKSLIEPAAPEKQEPAVSSEGSSVAAPPVTTEPVSVAAAPTTPASNVYEKPKAADFRVKPFDLKTDQQSRLPWIFRPVPTQMFRKRNEGALTEGESLYKVAVSDGVVTIEEAVEIGLANNIQVQALKKKIEVAQSKWMEAKRAMFPTVQFEADLNGGHAPSSQKFYKGEAYKVNANQPLYYGGELVLTAKQAEENVKSAKAELQKAKNEYVHQVRTSYFGVVKAEYNVQYQIELYRQVSEFYKMAKSSHDQKVMAEVDFLNAESQYEQVYFQVDSSQNDLQSASLVLHQTLNMDSDAEIPVDLKLTFKKIDVNYHEMLELYFKKNPDLQIKQLAFISAKYGVQIYQAKKQPRFDLRGSYGYLAEAFKDSATQAADKESGESDSVIDLEKEWYLGVHGSMPLGANSVEYDQIKHKYGPTISAFNGGSEDWRHTFKFNLMDKFSDITDEKSAKATLLQAEADWQKAKYDAAVKLKDDFYNLQKSLIQMDSSIAKIRYQEKQNSILKYTLSLQEGTVATYLEGLVEQSQNRFAFIQAVVDYQLALSSLSASIGDPFYFSHEN